MGIDGPRIRLARDFAARNRWMNPAHRLQEPNQRRRRYKGGCSTPKEDRLRRDAGERRSFYLRGNRLHRPLHDLPFHRIGVEVAVPALRGTERDMDVTRHALPSTSADL